jgi:hypothetical protein
MICITTEISAQLTTPVGRYDAKGFITISSIVASRVARVWKINTHLRMFVPVSDM